MIARNGVPVAKIVKYDAPRIKPPGVWQDKLPYSTDWNSAQTNTEVERLFHENGGDAPSA